VIKAATVASQADSAALVQLREFDRGIAERIEQGLALDPHLAAVRALHVHDLISAVRTHHWAHLQVNIPAKKQASLSVCRFVASVVRATAAEGPVLSAVPEAYLEALIEAFHALRRFDQSQYLFDRPSSLDEIVELFVERFTDTRLNPDLRDSLLQSICVALQYQEYVAVFEKNSAALRALCPGLIASFNNRFWVSVTNILVRLLRGTGIGETAPPLPPLPPQPDNGGTNAGTGIDNGHGSISANGSASGGDGGGSGGGNGGGGSGASGGGSSGGGGGDRGSSIAVASAPLAPGSVCFQDLLHKVLNDTEVLGTFMNQLLNNLNWTLTELRITEREIAAAAAAPTSSSTTDAAARVKKASIMFELSLSMLIILDFLASRKPDSLASGAYLSRVTEVVIWVLASSKGSSATGARGAGAEEVARTAKVLEPASGLLGHIFAHAPVLVADSLAAQPSCTEEALAPLVRANPARLAALPAAISERRTATIAPADELLCTICYSAAADTTILPCKHITCRVCIDRHLCNSAKCFFCNTPITGVENKAM
jgi:hypothetical protein